MKKFNPNYHEREDILSHYQEQRNARIRKKRRRYNIKRILLALIILAAVLFGLVSCSRAVIHKLSDRSAQKQAQQKTDYTLNENGMIQVGKAEFLPGYSFDATNADSIDLSDVASSYGILVNVNTGEVIAGKASDTIINPASMTKILTVLVAAEQLGKDFDDTVTYVLPQEVTDYAFVNKCSTAGFLANETVTLRDLFYGTILPSGGESAQGLAYYVSGSQDVFVSLMNAKLDALGISKTAHFTNVVGLYDESHKCTVADMAVILKAAMENDYCREVLSAHVYTTSSTTEHPDGIIISNWFLRRIEDKETRGLVVGAKTGYVNQSGNCAASYYLSESGTPYICVTGNAYSSWRAIKDHVAIYNAYTK